MSDKVVREVVVWDREEHPVKIVHVERIDEVREAVCKVLREGGSVDCLPIARQAMVLVGDAPRTKGVHIGSLEGTNMLELCDVEVVRDKAMARVLRHGPGLEPLETAVEPGTVYRMLNPEPLFDERHPVTICHCCNRPYASTEQMQMLSAPFRDVYVCNVCRVVLLPDVSARMYRLKQVLKDVDLSNPDDVTVEDCIAVLEHVKMIAAGD